MKAFPISIKASIGILQAYRTLGRATSFFGSGPGRAGWAGDALHAKVLGNGLRELDRFLHVLLDEVAAAARCDVRVDEFTRLRNTASKLLIVSDRLGLPKPDLERWRALGRCRDCLFYNSGIVRRADLRAGTTMTLGWPGSIDAKASLAASVAIGETLPLTSNDVAWVCRAYDRIAEQLIGRSATD